MLRNYFLINIVLVIILGFLGFKLYKVVTYSMDIPVEAVADEGQGTKDIDITLNGKVPDKASFEIIAQKDLFRPSRTASVTDVRKTPTGGIVNYPKLFATIIRERDSIAIIEDPGTKKTKPYGVNDLVAGFKVLEILEDKVILLSGDEKVEIKLRDDKGITTLRPQPVVRPNIEQNIEPNRTRRPTPVRRAPRRVPPPVDTQNEIENGG